MKVKIFDAYGCSKSCSKLEKEINDFLGGFYKIERINFTYLRDNTILCSYEGETWEAYHDRTERTFAANDAIRLHYDQMKDSYQ